jgi:ketosteroid isomerase-like protein
MANLLEEKDAIHEIMANYCFYFDAAEFDDWLDLFTEDGTFDGGSRGIHKGKDALRTFVQNFPLTGGSPMLRHCVMNEIIKVDGDTASAKSYVLVVRPSGEGALVNGLAGRYEDQFVKQGDRWLLKYRKVHFDLMGNTR